MFYSNYFYCLAFLIFFTEAVKEPELPRVESIAQSECSNITQYDKLYDGYCYELVTNLRYSWHEASSYCRSNGAELVSIHSNEEESVVKKLKNVRNTDVGIWIGLHTSCFVLKFEWSDGTPFVISQMWSFYTRCGLYYKGSDLSYNSEICFSIDDAGLWRINYCSETKNFICKREVDSAEGQDLSTLTPHISQPGKCKTDWNSFGDYCYLLVGQEENDWLDFENANEACALLNGSLASVKDKKEQVFLTYLLQNVKYDVWIGFRKNITTRAFSWTDNSSVTYSHWSVFEPYYFGEKEYCASMLHSPKERGFWNVYPCNRKFPYICKAKKDPIINTNSTPLSANCAGLKDWLGQGHSCFKFFSENKTWNEAEVFCEKFGAQLISITDVDVQSTFKYLSVDTNLSIWIGLSQNLNRSFEWISGFPITISYWDKNQPAPKGKNDTCIMSSSEGFWNTSPCQISRPFICRTSENGKDKSSQEVTYSKPCVYERYIQVNEEDDYCYRIMRNIPLEVADKECNYFGCQISSFHSLRPVENLKIYLRKLRKNGVHLTNFTMGLSRNQKGGFTWLDHSAVDFEYWDENEPKDLNAFCFEMDAETMKWRTTECKRKNVNVICSVKREKTIEVTSTTRIPSNAASEIHQFTTQQIHYTTETKDVTSTISITSNAVSEIQQFTTQPTYSTTNAKESSTISRASIKSVATQKFPQTSTEPIHSIPKAEITTSSSSVSSHIVPGIHQLSTESSLSTYEVYNPTSNASVTSNVIDKIYTLPSKISHSTHETKEVTSAVSITSNAASENNQIATHPIYYTTDTEESYTTSRVSVTSVAIPKFLQKSTEPLHSVPKMKEVTSTISITSNAAAEIHQFTTQPINSTTKAEESSTTSRGSITSVATPKFPPTSTEPIHSIPKAEKTTSSSNVSSDIVPGIHQLSTESSLFTYEVYNRTSNASVTSNVIVNIHNLPSKPSHSTHEPTNFPFSDDTSFTTTARNLQSSAKFTIHTQDSKTSTSISATALVGILIFIFLMVAAISGTYFYFKPHLRKRLRNFLSNGGASESVLYGVNTGLLIQKNEDKKDLIPASSTL